MPDIENIKEESREEPKTQSLKEVNENIPKEEIIETTQPETPNLQFQTENMEVHKHPHHVMHKKKWNEYLLEFFMLFLAVFLGFIAENQREHLVESSRAKDYAKSFLTDLKADTAELGAAESDEKFIRLCIDSITSISNNIKHNQHVPGSFYYYSRFMSNLWVVSWSGSTIQQLVQSGNLRYFKNKELVQKINNYYAWQNVISSINRTEHETRMQSAELRNKILKSRYYLLFVPLNTNVEKQNSPSSPELASLMKQEFPLQEEALQYLDQYINVINDRKWRSATILNGEYPEIKNLAVEIMKLLQQEYNLK